MSDHEAAGVGETPLTAEDGEQDRYLPSSEDIEQVADRVIRYYFDLGELSDEQIQALGEARYKEIRLTDDEIDAMKAEIRGRVSGSVVLTEPTLPCNDPPPSADAAHGEEWDVIPPVLTEDETPAEEDIDVGELLAGSPSKGAKFGRTMAIPIVTLELYGPFEDKMHQMNRNGLRMNGSAVQSLSPDKTEVLTADGKSHPSCTGNDPDGTTYYAPHSQKALEAIKLSIVRSSGHKIKEVQLNALSPEDTVELFKLAKKHGEGVSFRDVVVGRIATVYGPIAADPARHVVGGALMSAYGKAIKDPSGSQRDEVFDALVKADKKSNGSNPAPSDAGPVEDSTSKTPGRPGNTPKEEGEQMTRPETSGATMTQQGNRPSVPVPPTIDLQGEPPQPRTGVTTAIREGVEPLGTQPGHDRENALSDDEFRQIGTIAGEDIEKLARKNFLHDMELQRLMARAESDDKLSSDERKELIATVRARQPKPAWKKAFEDHKAKLPYVGMAILALIVAGLVISRPSNANGVVTDPTAATVPTEVRTPIELVGTPVPCSQNVEGLWLIDAPMRVPSSLTHGEWGSMTWKARTTTVELPAGQQPGVLLNSLTHVRGADGKERLEAVLTRVGEVDLTKRKLVPHEVQ